MDTDALIKKLQETIRILERRITNTEINMKRLELKVARDKANKRSEMHNLDASIKQLRGRMQ